MPNVPYSSSNNYNSVETLAGYKIESGPVDYYLYKDSATTLALKSGSGGGGGPATWTLTDGSTNFPISDGDTVEWAGSNNTTIAITAAGTTTTVNQSAFPSGANREIQINDSSSTPAEFGTGPAPAKIDVRGNIITDYGTGKGEVWGSGYVPSQPTLPDTYDGQANPLAGAPSRFTSKIYKLKIGEGTFGMNINNPFNQQALLPYNPVTVGDTTYGFPASNDNIMWTASHRMLNAFNGIIGWIMYDLSVAPVPAAFNLSYLGLQPNSVEAAWPLFGSTGGPTPNDYAYYDPLNLRALEGGTWVDPTATAGPAINYTMGYNKLSLGPFPGILRVSWEVYGQWNEPPLNSASVANTFVVSCTCSDNSGVLRWNNVLQQHSTSFPILGATNPCLVSTSGSKIINTWDANALVAYNNAWYADDLLRFQIDMPYEPSNNQTFTIGKFVITVEYTPNP